LKTLLEQRLFCFGIDELQNVFNDLEFRNSDLAHLLTNQLTYVKNLDAVTVVNADAIVNFLNIVKDSLVQSFDKFHLTIMS
jgi:hypothetical protein